MCRDGFAVRLIHHMQLQMHAICRFAEVRVVELGFSASPEGDAEIVVALVEYIEPRFAGQRERLKLRPAKPGQIEGATHLRFVLRRPFEHKRRRVTLALPFPSRWIFELPLVALLERMLRQQRTRGDEAKKLKEQADDRGFTHKN